MRITWVALVCFILALATICSGWGQEGHKIVAQIASDRLTSEAKSIVTQFIGSDTLADIAPMPDAYDHSPAGRWSAPCHYCDLPRNATNFTMAYCPGFCVVKSVLNYTSILSKTESNPTACDFDTGVEPCALEFLVHYTGDIHQPLHVGYGDDRGGNSVKVEWFSSKSNLHQVWDEKIIQKWTESVDTGVKELEGMINNDPSLVKKYLSNMNPEEWADESFGYVQSTVYDFSDSDESRKEIKLGEAYYKRNLPIVKQRLIAGGLRLGEILNTVLVGRRTPKLNRRFSRRYT
jgi:hypothetical protein